MARANIAAVVPVAVAVQPLVALKRLMTQGWLWPRVRRGRISLDCVIVSGQLWWKIKLFFCPIIFIWIVISALTKVWIVISALTKVWFRTHLHHILVSTVQICKPMIQNSVEKFRPIHGLSTRGLSNFGMPNNFLRFRWKRLRQFRTFHLPL